MRNPPNFGKVETEVAHNQEVLGPDDETTLESMIRFAKQLQKRGDHEAAGKLLSRVGKSQEKQFGRDNYKTLYTGHLLAINLYKCGRYEDAKMVINEVLRGQRTVYGTDGIVIYESMLTQSSILRSLNEYRELAETNGSIVESARNLFGRDSQKYSGAIAGQAAAELKLENSDKVKPLIKELLIANLLIGWKWLRPWTQPWKHKPRSTD